jgi:hypothetical protein
MRWNGWLPKYLPISQRIDEIILFRKFIHLIIIKTLYSFKRTNLLSPSGLEKCLEMEHLLATVFGSARQYLLSKLFCGILSKMLMWGTIQGNVWYIYLYIWKLCFVQCTSFKYVHFS